MLSRNANSLRPHRDGVTLIELLLVLALIMICLGMALPMFFGTFKNQQLRTAADLLRSDLAEARNRSMSRGQTLGLIAGATNYTIAPVEEFTDENEASSTAPMFQQTRQLPDGIKLQASSANGTDPAALADSASTTSALNAGGVCAYFYPDGTTSTVEFQLTNDSESSLVVSLRGITGVALVQEAPSQNQGIIVAEIPAAKGGTP